MDNDKAHNKPKTGMKVEIAPRSDRSGKTRIQGTVSEVLTNADYHPHGILVRLDTGEVGRVKNILDVRNISQTITANNSDEKVSLKALIEAGETQKTEFKDRALWSANYTAEDIKNHRPQSKELHAYGQSTSKVIVAKTLAAFLNTNGGTLIIGVKENKVGGSNEVVGIETEYSSIKDSSQDGYRRMIVDLVEDYFPAIIFNLFDRYFQISFEKVDGHTVCGITVSKSDKRVFLKLNGKDHFFIRTDASIRELTGEEVVDYCQSHFT